MYPHRTLLTTLAATAVAAVVAGGEPKAQSTPLAMDTARVTIAGTSNVHSYRIWTDTVRVTRVEVAAPAAGASFWDDVVKPGGLETFEIAIPVATLTSRDEINSALRGVLDDATGKWGIRVNRVELKAIDPPASIKDTMEKQMRADREKRAAILQAEGQKQAAILTAEGEKQAAVLRA